MTPEGRVKEQVKKVLAAYKPHVYGNWIVQNGMGTPTLDYIGCCCGRYFSIETKAEGKLLTARQQKTAEEIQAANGEVFEIRVYNSPELTRLDEWLHERVMRKLTKQVGR
jgi:hypothetical protein